MGRFHVLGMLFNPLMLKRGKKHFNILNIVIGENGVTIRNS